MIFIPEKNLMPLYPDIPFDVPHEVREEQKEKAWSRLIQDLQELGVGNIRVGGRFLTEKIAWGDDGGCVTEVYRRLSPYFTTGIDQDLTAKSMG